jgi:hypothetical protein
MRCVVVEELRERGRAIGRAVLEVRDTDGAELERALVLGMPITWVSSRA